MRYWETLLTDDGAHFDREIRLDAAKLPPLVTWGTNPEQVVSITGRVPRIEDIVDANKRQAAERSLAYMGLKGGEKISDIAIDRVFIGSCTNGRIEDLRAAAKMADGKKVNANVNAMIVPGSGLVKEQAEAEGLDKIFVKAGFEWREPGCSMCLAMNQTNFRPKSAALRPRTAISRAARATRAVRTSSRPPWPRPPPSRAISSMCGSGSNRHSGAHEARARNR